MKFNRNLTKKIFSIFIIFNILNFNIITSYAAEKKDDSIENLLGSLVRQAWVSWCTFFENNNEGSTDASVMYRFWGQDEESDVGSNTGFGMNAVQGNIVLNAKRIHDYIKENSYAYSCTHNVSNGYSNSCTCNSTSCFGKPLNANTVQQYYNIRCIDCSAFVSWVLYESGIDIGRQTSHFFYNQNYVMYAQYNWTKITDWNDLQPGDVLVRSGHVGIYEGNGYTLEAGSTNSIRADHSYGSIASVASRYRFAVRVSLK